MKLDFSGQILEKFSNTKFQGNPFNGSRVPCGRAGTDGGTDMTELTEAFGNFVNALRDIDKVSVTGKLYGAGSRVFQIRHFHLYN